MAGTADESWVDTRESEERASGYWKEGTLGRPVRRAHCSLTGAIAVWLTTPAAWRTSSRPLKACC
jgi:hypothetical protein